MMRLMVCTVLFVCRVPKVRWPVSAMVRADSMVSRSRISPTSTTSGSWRRAERRAFLKLWVSAWISRWFTKARLCLWTYSTGSSMVRMCTGSSALILSTMAARVVGLNGGRQTQFIEAADLLGNGPERPRRGAPLIVYVGAEAGHALKAEGEVHLEILLEPVLLLVGHHAIAEPASLGRVEGRQLEGHHAPIDADLGRRVCSDVQIRAPVFH